MTGFPRKREFTLISTALAALLGAAMSGIAGCHRIPAAPEVSPKEAGATQGAEGVSLTSEQIAKEGIATQPAAASDYRTKSQATASSCRTTPSPLQWLS